MTRRTVVRLFLVTLVAACSHAAPRTAATVLQQGARFDPESGINAAELRRDMYAFADDSFRGRETGTADAQRAAAFLARRVQSLGLEPAGDSLYMQRVPLVRETLAPSTHVTVVEPNGRRQELSIGSELAPILALGNELPMPRNTAEGDVLFVGFGPRDDAATAALMSFDPAGKVIVALHGAPPKTPRNEAEKLNSPATLGLRLEYLISLHPAAIILLMTGDAAKVYDQLSSGLLRSITLDGQAEPTAKGGTDVPMLLIGVARRGSPVLPARWPNDVAPQLLGRQMRAQVDVDRTPLTGYNVVAVVRGHDPRMNKSYLAYGAHYDHMGFGHVSAHRGRRASFDAGADDDGSGSVALLAMAQQMMVYRPRRSVLFVWHIGEENGMLGSSYFTSHSTVPIDSIVTQFNADMIGRNGDSLSLIGPRAAPNYLSWRLGMIVDSVNFALEKPLHIERKWDDPDDPDQVYQRSDHYNYARKGIPVILFTTGTHADHHHTTDEPSKIEYDNLARVTRLMLEAGLVVANRSGRPTSEALTQSISNRH